MTKEKFRAKKFLGQNFLRSPAILRRIVVAGDPRANEIILEIGPGTGTLTEHLLATPARIVAVEKDKELCQFLREKFIKEIATEKLILREGDILKFTSRDLGKLLAGSSYKIIANIPYNITGAILKKFLTEKIQPRSMVLMVQREVAQRMLAKNKKEGLLSLSIKAYGEPKLLMQVDRTHFTPRPAVDSSVIVIKNIGRRVFKQNKIAEKKFWTIVKKGFAHKRKRLARNLKNLVPAETLAPVGDKRAEDLNLFDWIKLAQA